MSLSCLHPAWSYPMEAFLSSTAVVALAEVGDKTMLLAIVLAARLIEVHARPCRAHQGWRYLEPGDAPSDLDGKGPALSADLEAALKEALAW